MNAATAEATEAAESTGFEDGEAAGDSLVVDLSKVEDASFEAIPAGIYSVAIDELKFELSKNSGKPMWNTRFTITDGEFTGRKLFTYISFSEKALPMTKKNIAALAPELLEGPFDPKVIAEEGQLMGKECRVKVKIEKYEGEDRNRVNGILAASAGGFA